MSSANDATYGKTADLKKSLGAVRQDLNGLGNDVADLATKVTSEAKQRLDGLSDRAQTISQDAFEQLQAQVRAKPGVALGVAAGVGILIGLIAASRR
jgi:ElaB/YqjD/DUF883 family membrane-anchored ribosome-binding protein